MILCIGAAAQLQLVTDAAGSIDVHASSMDVDASGTVTTSSKNTAITTATTTNITNAPPANVTRNIKTLTIRNKGATTVNVTVVHADGVQTVELHKAGLSPGDMLQYAEGVGFVEVPASSGFIPANANSADVVANAADTYLTGSSISNLTNFLRAGMIFRWRLTMSKTGAGVAAPLFNIRVGTAGAVGDAAACAFSGFSAQTAVIDNGWADVEAIVRQIGATGVIQGTINFNHALATTGLASVSTPQIKNVLSGSVNLSTAGLIIGLSCNPGASGVWTFQTVSVTAHGQIGDA